MTASKIITKIATINKDGLVKVIAQYELPPKMAITVFKNELTNWDRWAYGSDDPQVYLLKSGRYAYEDKSSNQVFFTDVYDAI
ncbi:hypothetical protein [Niallia taxi]|uniref:hypothetical protein n=1 Tax=Niallia taxi TaxID=2499688 RepID=UPI0015F5AD5A|nr:hypothetical protein [Niallia taxi]